MEILCDILSHLSHCPLVDAGSVRSNNRQKHKSMPEDVHRGIQFQHLLNQTFLTEILSVLSLRMQTQALFFFALKVLALEMDG